MILIAGGSTGWGHLQAAKNVAGAISQLRIDSYVKDVNIFASFPEALEFFYEGCWRFASCHLQRLYGSFYRHSTTTRRNNSVLEWLAQKAAERISDDFPNLSVFVATHSFAARVGSLVKARVGCRLCVAATDFIVHSLQIFDNVDFYYVPPMYAMTAMLANPKEFQKRAYITGIPIATTFAATKDRTSLRRHLQLSPDLITVLVSFGGSGLKGERHVDLFADILKEGLPVQFVILTGHNLAFAQAVQQQYGSSRYADRIQMHSFLNDVSDIYAAADLFVGKAGGLTISEALAAGLPMAFVDALPGQEECNIDVICSGGLGTYVGTREGLIRWLLAADPQSAAEQYKVKSRNFGRPRSSIDVAQHVALLTGCI